MRRIYAKYAKLLINYSLGLKKGDRILVQSTYLAEPLLREVHKAALEAGAHPEYSISFHGQDKIFYDFGSDEQFGYVSPRLKLAGSEYEAMLYILAPFDMKELVDVDPAKIQKVHVARGEINKIMLKRHSQGNFRWTLCVFPTAAAARECKMSIAEYRQFVFSACFLLEDDPVAKWNQLRDDQQRIVDYLTGKEQIQFLGRDIDVTFSAKGRKWINSSGTNNMPSGEVFTCPVEDSVNGKIRFSYPGFYMGKEIEDIVLEIQNGEVVQSSATKGKELLDKILEIPGAKRFGEAAVGTNHRITKFTKNMLFDEKIGGTIHMALGTSLAEAGGVNESAIHWDMLADMHQSGQIFADGELVYENGNFLI
ncbi:MAG: aminopeptidase [Phycisphaerae bacterium]